MLFELFRHAQLSKASISTPSPSLIEPIVFAPSSPAAANAWRTADSSSFATIKTIPNPQLNVLHISLGATFPTCIIQLNTAGNFHVLTSIDAAKPEGNTRGTLSTNPPPVICASALTRSFVSAPRRTGSSERIYNFVGVKSAAPRVVSLFQGHGEE